MSTEVLTGYDAPGKNVYFVIWNAARQILDHADHTFKAVAAPPTTLGLAATEKTDLGGVNESSYEASLNLAYLNSTPTIQAFQIEQYRRAGGSQSLSADLKLSAGEIRVAGSEIVEGGVGSIAKGYTVRCGFNTVSTDGAAVDLYAWVEKDGKPATLAGTETCVFEVYEFKSNVLQFPSPAAVTPSGNGQFEAQKTSGANLTDDKQYLVKATVTIGSTTITGFNDQVVVGGA